MMVLKQSRQNPRVKIRFIHEATKLFKTRSNDIVMWKPKYVKRSFYMHAEIWEDGRVGLEVGLERSTEKNYLKRGSNMPSPFQENKLFLGIPLKNQDVHMLRYL